MPILKEIAREFGVSVATVSNALSGKGRMSSEKRRLIVETASERGYMISEKSRRITKKNICIIIEHMGTPVCNSVVEGIFSSPIWKEYTISTYNLAVLSEGGGGRTPNQFKLAEEIENLLENIVANINVAGMIYVSQYPRDLTGLVKNPPFPVVYTLGSTKDPYSTVNSDNRHGAYIAAEHLIKNGRKQIMMISGPIDSVPMTLRALGFQHAFIDYNLAVDYKMMFTGDWQKPSGYAIMSECLNGSVIPDAVFAQSDEMAIGAMVAVLERGIRVPEDISIVGYDNSDKARFCIPTLTSVNSRLIEVGKAAIKKLDSIIKNENTECEQILIPCELVVRTTTNGF